MTSFQKIVDLAFSAHLLPEADRPSLGEEAGYIAFDVIEISEGPGPGRTGLHAGRHDLYSNLLPLLQSPVDPVKAEGAFFHDPVGSGGVGPLPPDVPVGRQVVVVVLLLLLLAVVEASRPVRAGHHAVLASEAPPEVLDDDPVLASVGRLRRADRHARGMIAMHAGHGDHLRRHAGILTPSGRDHLVPVDLSSAPLVFRRAVRDIILFLAGHGTSLTTDALVQVNDHSPSRHLFTFLHNSESVKNQIIGTAAVSAHEDGRIGETLGRNLSMRTTYAKPA